MTDQRGDDEGRRRLRLFDRHRPRRLAGARSSACPSATPITSPAAPWRWPRSKGCDLADLSLDELQAIHPGITDEVFDVLTVEASVASRTSYGGTAPDRGAQADRLVARAATERSPPKPQRNNQGAQAAETSL